MLASARITNDTKWPKATREHPCRKCGKFNRCLHAPDGTGGICWRSGSKEVWQDKVNGHTHYNGNGKHHADPKPTKPKTTYVSAEAAIDAAGKFIEGGKCTAVYTYPADVARVARFDLPDGGKECRPVHRVANGWQIGDPPGKWPVYRADELPTGGTIYVTEGEKCADIARKIGLHAVTSAHGSNAADSSDWTPVIEHGGEIVLLPDADDSGEKYAAHVARIIFASNPSARIKITRLPGLSNGEDVEQFCEGESPERIRAEVEALASETPFIEPSAIIGGPIVTPYSDIKRQPIRWLWPGKIALGKLCLVYGDPEKGKSTFLVYLAATISRGGEWPDGSGAAPRGTVIYLSYEDDAADTTGPRMDAANADSTRVLSLSGIRYPAENGKMIERGVTLGDTSHFRDILRRYPDMRAIFIDPVSAAMPDKKDGNSNTDIRGMLSELSKIAAEFGVAIIMLTHKPKHGTGKAIYAAMGSLAFLAAARSAWLIAVDPANPDGRLMLCAKNNLAPHGDNLAFHIEGPVPHVVWDGAVSTTADEALHAEDNKEQPGPEPKAMKAAKEWLEAELADMQEHPVEALKNAAKAAAISWRTVQRASREIDVKYHRAAFGSGYVWRLPKVGTEGDAPLRANMHANDSGVWQPGNLAHKENHHE
jgi:putative DNA primase/helicase